MMVDPTTTAVPLSIYTRELHCGIVTELLYIVPLGSILENPTKDTTIGVGKGFVTIVVLLLVTVTGGKILCSSCR